MVKVGSLKQGATFGELALIDKSRIDDHKATKDDRKEENEENELQKNMETMNIQI